MANQRSLTQLAKFLSYILERRPDEFGLIPDKNGFVKIKDLLKAVNEEPELGYIRRSHINEVLISTPSCLEMTDDTIRAVKREHLSGPSPVEHPPAILFTCIRQKAHMNVLNNGIHPQGGEYIVLSSNQEMAERIGKRKDPNPLLLRVHTAQAHQQGIKFHQSGETLYLADYIPAGCFTAPPLPKKMLEKEKTTPSSKRPKQRQEKDFTPGSFYPDFNADKKSEKTGNSKQKSRKDTWKHDRKKLRKQKEKMWPT